MPTDPSAYHLFPDHDLVEAFLRALEGAGVKSAAERSYEVAFKALDGVQRLDAVVRLQNEPRTILAIECKRNAFPKDIKSALWQLDEFARITKRSGDTVVPVLLAERLSPGARDALRHREVAFYDESGTLYFRHGPVTIDIDREPLPEKRSQPGSPFIGAREQVVHALLHMKDRSFTGQELAQVSQTSPYTVSQTLQILQQMGWVEGQAAGRGAQRRLVSAGSLLDAWSDSWKRRHEASSSWFSYSGKQGALPTQVASELLSAGMSGWAYTGAAAGNALTPLLTQVDRLQIIVPLGTSSEIASAARLSAAKQGSNVTLIERTGASDLFRRPLPEYNIPLASPFIIYLDLMKDERGRNKELAQELRLRLLRI